MLAPDVATSDELRTCRELVRSGRIRQALVRAARLEKAHHAAERTGGLAVLIECRLARGELAGAIRAAEPLAALQDEPGVTGAVASYALAELATACGDHDTAAALYNEAGCGLGGFDDPLLLPWRAGAALAMTRLSRHRDARLLAHAHLDLCRRTDSAYAVAQALRTVAATDPGSRDREAMLREAVATLSDTLAGRLSAQIATDLAALLVLHGAFGSAREREEAVGLLRGAEAYAAREDLPPLLDRIARQLVLLGEEPCRQRRELLAGLTSTEQRAAELAADGLKNREIAATLDVTVKAVEWHLSNIYKKLGISGRAGLLEAFGAN
ncbi:LuxR C-terminal-related transcriptional regulator [Nocardioides sp. GCM10027113]|uniref:helix-turn-helix transcriptional regulator n=1 Tax=unclassified Nocardioides TaxID=2615069 RepID=UPI00360FE94B